MDWLTFAKAGLAAYRLSLLISADDGPFDIFSKLRAHIDPKQRTWYGRGIRCVWCVSFWLTLILVLVAPFIPMWVIDWLALAGLVVLIYSHR